MRLRALLPFALVALIALTVFGNLPGDRRLYIEAQDSAHAYAFVFVTWILLGLRRSDHAGLVRYATVAAIAIAIGIGIELAQSVLGRDASASDVLRDTLGIAAGICIHAAFLRGSAQRPRPQGKLAFCGVAVLCLTWATWPTGEVVADMARKARDFPVIAKFSPPLRRHLDRGVWPRIALDEPYPDWRGYRTLVVELGNPDPVRSLPLTLRVHDRAHDQTFWDRYNHRFTLPPASRQQLRLSLADIRSAPHDRQMDMSRIAGIVIYARGPMPGREFYLEGVWLE